MGRPLGDAALLFRTAHTRRGWNEEEIRVRPRAPRLDFEEAPHPLT
jgi:hypothetical protein